MSSEESALLINLTASAAAPHAKLLGPRIHTLTEKVHIEPAFSITWWTQKTHYNNHKGFCECTNPFGIRPAPELKTTQEHMPHKAMNALAA